MDYAGHEKYYIKEDALLFILAAIGIEDWYQFSDIKCQEKASKEEINKLLARLYQESYVTWENGTIRLLEPLNTLAYIVKNSHYCVSIRMERLSYYCYCFKNKVLVIEPGKQDYDKLRFSIWEKAHFVEYLWSLGIFPEEELEIQEDEMWMNEVHTKAILTLSEKDLSKQKCEMTVSETGIFTYITVAEGTNTWKKLYCRQYCRDTIEKWLQMEE